jgi:hypothetical protein
MEGDRLAGEAYPDDYPAEVFHLQKTAAHPGSSVKMADWRAGRSSIGFFESIYYMVKVFLAIFVLTLRRPNKRSERVHG